MKKILSFTLAAVMLVSAVPTAFASGIQDYSQGTQVVFEATNNEGYTITVPAKLNPGQSGTVTVDGMWPSNKTVTVTAEPTVTLTNSILASDQKVLDVTFLGISKAGNDTAAKTYTETVSVAAIEDALFGTWSGKFNYNVVFDSEPRRNLKFKFGKLYTYEPSPGEQVTLYDADENVLRTYTTDANGEITLVGLTSGYYTIKGNDYSFWAQISEAGEVTSGYVETLKSFYLLDTNRRAGVTIQLYDTDSVLLAEYVTDDNGRAALYLVPEGTYYVQFDGDTLSRQTLTVSASGNTLS